MGEEYSSVKLKILTIYFIIVCENLMNLFKIILVLILRNFKI